jgi:hypothetical protein
VPGRIQGNNVVRLYAERELELQKEETGGEPEDEEVPLKAGNSLYPPYCRDYMLSSALV